MIGMKMEKSTSNEGQREHLFIREIHINKYKKRIFFVNLPAQIFL